MSAAEQAAPAAEQDGTLRKGILPLWAVYGIALGILAPSSTLALSTGLISETAGNLSWLTWVVTSVIVLSFALGISWLTRRFTSTGGLYGLAARAGGRTGGFSVMSAHVLALLLAGPACALGSAIYLDAWLERVGMPAGHSAAVVSILVVLVVAASAWLCYREVKLSARLLLAIEFATVGVILILFCVVLIKAPGGIIDSRQLHFGGMHVASVLEAGGFAVFALAGFENVATLGREARNPRRAIGLAMTGSIVALGLLYVFASYVIVLGSRASPSPAARLRWTRSPAATASAGLERDRPRCRRQLLRLQPRHHGRHLAHRLYPGPGPRAASPSGQSTRHTADPDRRRNGARRAVPHSRRRRGRPDKSRQLLWLPGHPVRLPARPRLRPHDPRGGRVCRTHRLVPRWHRADHAGGPGRHRPCVLVQLPAVPAGRLRRRGMVPGCVALAVIAYAALRLGWPAALARIGRTDRSAQADEPEQTPPAAQDQAALASGRQ